MIEQVSTVGLIPDNYVWVQGAKTKKMHLGYKEQTLFSGRGTFISW